MNESSADFAEARWRRLADADAVGTPLSGSDREYLDQFTPRSAQARAEAELFAALGRMGDSEESSSDDSALVRATVEHVMAARRVGTPVLHPVEPQPQLEPEPPELQPARRWGLLGLAAAAAVVVGWLGVQAMSASVSDDPPRSPIAKVSEPEGERVDSSDVIAVSPKTSPDAEAGFVLGEGRLLDAEGSPLAARAEARGPLQVESERGCVRLGEATACFQRGARFEVDAEQPTRLVLVEGEGDIEVPSIVGSVMTVEIAGDHYTVDRPLTMHTTVHERGSSRVRVIKGRVELVDAEGRAHVLEAGQVREQAREARAGSRPDAKTLLARARASRSAGDRLGAIAHYEKLLRLHPRASASRPAMISLGDLYVEIGKPSVALTWFDRYLRKGGALAQEAYLGRIKALGAMGRDRQQQRAIEAFRTRYPSSRYADRPGG